MQRSFHLPQKHCHHLPPDLLQYGVGQTLERPEMLVMTSGNQAELVVDWWTLCDYAFTQYMPSMEFTFYSDSACTQEVLTDVVDL